MGAYGGFRTSNSKRVIDNRDKNLVGDTLKILSTLQERQDRAVAKRDEIEAGLEDTTVADQDRPAWESFKEGVRKKLETIPESAYIGDMDRQITKIARTAKKGVDEVQGNYKRRYDYVEEGKKAGLDEQRLSQHVEISNQRGGLEYDPSTGDFKNRFQGIAYTKAPSAETISKAMELLKPTTLEYDKNGQHVKEVVYNPDSEENKKILKLYTAYNPELQKELQFQNTYSELKASKFDYNKLSEEGKDAAVSLMAKHREENPTEAYRKELMEKNSNDVFGLVYSNAKLRTQHDLSSELSKAGEKALDYQYDLGKINATQNRLDAREKYKEQGRNARAALKEGSGEGSQLLTDDIARTPYGDTVDKNGVLEEKGFFSKVGEAIGKVLTDGYSNNKDKNSIWKTALAKKYDLGEVGHNYMLNNNRDYAKLDQQLQGTTNKTEQVRIKNKMESMMVDRQDEIAKEIYKSGTMKSPKIIAPISKKAIEKGGYMLESILGRNLSGGVGDGLQVKEIVDGKEVNETTIGALRSSLGKRATISADAKERRELAADGSLIYEGMSGFDGNYINGIRFSVTDDDGEKRQFVAKVPDATLEQQLGAGYSVSKTKNGYIDKQGLSKAQTHFRSNGVYVDRTGPKEVTLEKHKGNEIRVIGKNGNLIETVKIDEDGNIIN